MKVELIVNKEKFEVEMSKQEVDNLIGGYKRANRLFENLKEFAREYDATFQPLQYFEHKYAIMYDELEKHTVLLRYIGENVYSTIWFDNKAVTRLAMELFEDELIWYLTEYKK